MQRILGLGSYHTAWNWLHKLRRAMVRLGRDRLAGTVEADEIYLGGPRSGKRGRGAAGQSLGLVLVQESPQGLGQIRLARVPDASAASLELAIEQAIEPGSEVRTDDWNGYRGLAVLGYRHNVVRAEAVVGGICCRWRTGWPRCSNAGCWARIKGRSVRHIWTTIWMNSRFGLTGGPAGSVGCCSTDCWNRP